MDALNLNHSSPKAFILAADGRFTSFRAENDQVWELNLNSRGTHPISLHTTYGLRARSMRLFPSFTNEREHGSNAGDFLIPPSVIQQTPDSIYLLSSSKEGVEVHFECFVPAEDTLVGGIEVLNDSPNLLNLSLVLTAVLAPMGKGTPTRPDRDGINQIIIGQTGDLHPVLFMTGGPNAVNSPYPALSVSVQLPPGKSRRLNWALVTKNSRESSLAAARRVTASAWRKTVRAHVIQQAGQTLQIRTGNPDWDAAFSLTQVQAMTHLAAQKKGQSPCFLRSRLPDEACSRPDRTNPDDLTVLEALHLAQVLLPTRPETLSAIIEHFLTQMNEDTQRAPRVNPRALTQPVRQCPLLAQLSLALYRQTGDEAVLKSAFPRLSQTLDDWFLEEGSFNADHLPTWDDPRQLQLDSGLFNFDVWETTGNGLDIHQALSPALLAMLHNEAAALSRIAKILKDRGAQRKYEALGKTLRDRLQTTWNEDRHQFNYLDLHSGQNPSRELYYPGRVQPELRIQKTFLKPQRMQLHLFAADENTRACRIQIIGESTEGDPIREVFKGTEIRWVMGRAHLTTQHLYQSLQSLSLQGLQPEDRFLLETADLSQSDISCLLPLWAGACTEEQCAAILETCLDPAAPSHLFGIPETWKGPHELPAELPLRANVLWSTLIIEGLLKAGCQDAAVECFSHLMTAITGGLRDYAGFFPYYDAHDGRPAGPRNALSGLAPLQLFLALAGIRLFTPSKLAIWGRNPFPWPIEVHWQGLSIRRDGAQTNVTFPDGTVYIGKTGKSLLLMPKKDKEVALA